MHNCYTEKTNYNISSAYRLSRYKDKETVINGESNKQEGDISCVLSSQVLSSRFYSLTDVSPNYVNNGLSGVETAVTYFDAFYLQTYKNTYGDIEWTNSTGRPNHIEIYCSVGIFGNNGKRDIINGYGGLEFFANGGRKYFRAMTTDGDLGYIYKILLNGVEYSSTSDFGLGQSAIAHLIMRPNEYRADNVGMFKIEKYTNKYTHVRWSEWKDAESGGWKTGKLPEKTETKEYEQGYWVVGKEP